MATEDKSSEKQDDGLEPGTTRLINSNALPTQQHNPEMHTVTKMADQVNVHGFNNFGQFCSK